MSAFLRFYTISLQRRPLATSMVASFTLFAAGDVLAQQVVERRGSEHDYIRTLRLGAYGGAIFTPIVLPWYKVIDRVPFKSKAANIATKVALDQFIFAPSMIAFFFGCTSLMEGKSFNDIKHKLETSYWSTLQANWLLFIPFQTVNMAFVPLQHRLLAVNFISLFWNTYLSLAAASGTDPQQAVMPGGDKDQKMRLE